MQSKKFILSLCVILSFLWLIGPYLAIAGIMPLATLYGRFIASFGALLFLLLYEKYRGGQFFPQESLPEEVENELQTIKQNLKRTLQALYSNKIKSFLFKYKKPWYLVLGPTQSGKSTLLSKADINLKGIDGLPAMTITPTANVNWWLADEAVFVDISGNYLREKTLPQYKELLFKHFFKLLKKFRAHKPINGLILTINLQELTVNTKEHTQLKNLQRIINEMVQQFVNFPIYLFITRCDTIEGFSEFFEDLTLEERKQIFGISFPLSIQPESLPQLFNDQYNALLERLNESVIWRINKEHHLDKIGKIKNFPLQMEFLKNPLAKLLNIIMPAQHLQLRGIFFTSAAQKEQTIDNLTKSLSSAYGIPHNHQTRRANQSKIFFIGSLFKRIIFPEAGFFQSNNKDSQLQSITSLMIIFISIGCLFFFFQSYRYNIETINNAQEAIESSTKQLSATHPTSLLKRLDLLQTIITQLNQKTGPWYTHIGMEQPQALQKKAQRIYDELLISHFLPYLQRTLEIQLQNINNDNTNQLYATLKAYLMLTDQKHLDKTFFANWFMSYWHQINDNSVNSEHLNNHLAALFNLGFLPQKVNTPLIESKRERLNSMPQSKLVLTLLQSQYLRAPVRILTEPRLKIFNNIPSEVSGIFNITNFKNIYYKEITMTCQEITHGDWVLSKQPQPAFSDITLNQLANEVKAIYLNEYFVTWSEILRKIKIDQITDLNQAASILEQLNNSQSPLIQLINIIKNNTQPLSDSVEFTQQISSHFLALNSLSNDLLKNANQASLAAVKQYIDHIVQSPDIERASYEAAKNRMENSLNNDPISLLLQQARTLPEPLQTWHTTLAVECWRIILNHTQSFLNKTWMTSVYPQYKALLDKRYPLFKESTIEASVTDFANFFGYGGIMDSFFKNYLQPFVDNSRLYWEWKNVDGQRLNISQNNLEMFIRAALIQKMFFVEESRVASISFSLIPVDLDSNIQSFTLNLDGQQIVFQKDNEQIISLLWPGPQPGHCEITLVDDKTRKSVLAENGQWAWFKILDKSSLEGTNNPKHFKLIFVINGMAVHYELYANGIVNPFIPGILNAFRCPENL
jgi:type VI secretion system protein ImpL